LSIAAYGLKVDAHVKCPSLNSAGKVPFIVDTGSPRTLLSVEDGKRLGIEVSSLNRCHAPIYGIGGPSRCWDLPEAILFFRTDQELEFLPKDDILVYKNPEKRKKGQKMVLRLASILGRDFLKESGFKLTVDMKNEKAYLEK
jgi:hypothetical protein